MKKYLMFIALVLFLIIPHNLVVAADVSTHSIELDEINTKISFPAFDTYYSMPGMDIVTNAWYCPSIPYFYINLMPSYFESTTYSGDMVVMLQKYYNNSWVVVKNAAISLRFGGSITLAPNSGGTYRLQFHSVTGYKATGHIHAVASY